MDPYQFSLLSNKQQFILQLKSASTATRKIDEGGIGEDGAMNFSEYVALLSGNTNLLEKVRLERQLSAVESSYSVFLQSQANNKARFETKVEALPKYRHTLENLKKDRDYFKEFHAEKMGAMAGGKKKFTYPNPVKLGDKQFVDPTELGKALLVREKEIVASRTVPTGPVATYGEFKLHVADLEDHRKEDIYLSYHVTRGEIKYTHSTKSFNQESPNVTGRYLINALNKLDDLTKNHQVKVEKTEKDIQSLEQNRGEEFQKLDELKELKKQVANLDERIASGAEHQNSNIMATDNSFELLKTNVELDRFLETSEGFEFFSKDSKKVHSTSTSNLDGYEYKVYKDVQGSSTSTTLLVSRNSNGHYVYNNPNDSADKGTIIDYLRKHKQMDWKDITSFAQDSAMPLPVTVNPTRKTTSKDKSTPADIIKVEGYQSSSYYKQERAIEDVIMDNEYIKNSINHVKFKRANTEGTAQVLFGDAFPIKNHKGEITTFNMKSEFFKKGMFLGERKSGLWYAIPEQKPTAYIIGEAAIDVISYYKNLQTTEPMALVSTEGRFSTRYADELEKLDPNLKQADILLVNDNDVHGFHYDLAWIQHLHNLPFSIGTQKTSPTELAIRIESVDKHLARELEPFQANNFSLKPEAIVPAIKHIKKKYGIDKMLIHKSPGKDWNEKILSDAKKKKGQNQQQSI